MLIREFTNGVINNLLRGAMGRQTHENRTKQKPMWVQLLLNCDYSLQDAFSMDHRAAAPQDMEGTELPSEALLSAHSSGRKESLFQFLGGREQSIMTGKAWCAGHFAIHSGFR